MLWQQRKAAQIQHLIAVFIHKFQHSLHETFRAFELYILLSGRQQSANCVHINATLHESSTRGTQLVQIVKIGCIQNAWKKKQVCMKIGKLIILYWYANQFTQ